MKNTLVDLNNALFEQLERLFDKDCDFEQECKRAKAVQGVSDTIIANAELALKAEQFRQEYEINSNGHMPTMLEHK